jgi:hypothetical protein
VLAEAQLAPGAARHQLDPFGLERAGDGGCGRRTGEAHDGRSIGKAHGGLQVRHGVRECGVVRDAEATRGDREGAADAGDEGELDGARDLEIEPGGIERTTGPEAARGAGGGPGGDGVGGGVGAGVGGGAGGGRRHDKGARGAETERVELEAAAVLADIELGRIDPAEAALGQVEAEIAGRRAQGEMGRAGAEGQVDVGDTAQLDLELVAFGGRDDAFEREILGADRRRQARGAEALELEGGGLEREAGEEGVVVGRDVDLGGRVAARGR